MSPPVTPSGVLVYSDATKNENGGGRVLHSNGNPYRTRMAGELRAGNVGERVRLAGWVSRRRDHGGLIFIDVRDRWGVTQVTFHPDSGRVFRDAEELRPEWSISVEGEVARRPEGNENSDLPTGEVEVLASKLRVLYCSGTPPC